MEDILISDEIIMSDEDPQYSLISDYLAFCRIWIWTYLYLQVFSSKDPTTYFKAFNFYVFAISRFSEKPDLSLSFFKQSF